MRRLTRDPAGFTLLEVLVVVVIISILASMALVFLLGALDRAKQRATMSDMRTIARAIEAYNVDNNLLPDDSGGLSALRAQMIPYSTNVLPIKDHWGHDIGYSSSDHDYTLESYGRDGSNGTDLSLATRFDFDSDIVIYNGVFVASPE